MKDIRSRLKNLETLLPASRVNGESKEAIIRRLMEKLEAIRERNRDHPSPRSRMSIAARFATAETPEELHEAWEEMKALSDRRRQERGG